MKSLLAITLVSLGFIAISPNASANQFVKWPVNTSLSTIDDTVNFQASNRKGSHRVGGTNSKGKGSKYRGGRNGR